MILTLCVISAICGFTVGFAGVTLYHHNTCNNNNYYSDSDSEY